VVKLRLQEEEEGGGGIAPSWRPRWWSPAPDSRRGAYRYGWRRRGEVYEGLSQAPPEEEEEVLHPPCHPGSCLLNEYKIKTYSLYKKDKQTNKQNNYDCAFNSAVCAVIK